MFNWVSNDKKYVRAVETLKKAGQPFTEEAVKALYIQYGGLVLGEDATIQGAGENTPIPQIGTSEKIIKKSKKK